MSATLTIATAACALGEILLYTLTNAHGASVTLSSLGAGIVSIVVPDREGTLADVTLGYDTPTQYLNDAACCGKTPGRYANRIGNARFTLDGREYTLTPNLGPNSLHGGPTGFANRLWESAPEGDNGVRFTYHSADGEEGFPGNLTVEALYRWHDDNTLEVTYTAVTDAPTVVNLTNHAYFNLDGSGSVLDHTLWLNARQYLLTDRWLLPTGEVAEVAGTPLDFTAAKPIGRDLPARGYDHCLLIADSIPGTMAEVAVLASPLSGRTLRVYSTQPGVQIYTAPWLRDGVMTPNAGIAIECQGLPDAPNKPAFPSQVLRPGEEYRQMIVWRFSAAD